MPRKKNDGDVSNYLAEQIMAEYVLLGNAEKVAKKYGVSKPTVMNVIRRMKDDYNEIREQKKAEMVQEIWGHLHDAMKLGHNMIKEALDGEREIPLNHVSTYFGTMYDKQALMVGEHTQNIGGDGIQVVLNMPDVQGEEEWKNKAEE